MHRLVDLLNTYGREFHHKADCQWKRLMFSFKLWALFEILFSLKFTGSKWKYTRVKSVCKIADQSTVPLKSAVASLYKFDAIAGFDAHCSDAIALHMCKSWQVVHISPGGGGGAAAAPLFELCTDVPLARVWFFGLAVLNRVYNLTFLCPKQGMVLPAERLNPDSERSLCY